MITKNYIKMCEKNEDLQKGHKWKNSDNLAYRRCINVRDCDYEESIKHPEYYEMTYRERMPKYNIDFDKPIYLPTQEQLQEMIKAYSSYEKINRFHEFVHLDADEYGWNKWCEFVNDASINELWLAFVMKEKYNKTWDGKIWK